MTEYKVVCTRDEYHNWNGNVNHYEMTSPIYGRTRHNHVYRSRAQAEQMLDEAIKGCAEHDARHDNSDRDNVKTRQYNFRIATREVSEWK